MKERNINKQDENIKQDINELITWNKTRTLKLQRKKQVRKWSWSENQDA